MCVLMLSCQLPLTPLLAHAHTSNLKGHVITSDLELGPGCCLWRYCSSNTTCTEKLSTRTLVSPLSVTGTYRAGSSAVEADCGAGGWGRWEAETCSEHGRLHWGALWFCGEVCHRCRCQDLEGENEKCSLC